MTEHIVVSTSRGDFACATHGSDTGRPLVCLHGFPDDATTYDGLGEQLAADGWRVISPYLRGYDPSPLDGDLTLSALADDLLALVDAVSPDEPVAFVGHDYGAQIGYAALTTSPERFTSAVMLAGAHPAVIARNARRMPRQWWMSRYIAFFQARGLAERVVARNDFAYVDALWRRWSPYFTMPPDHAARVKSTFRRSMPVPIEMYRAGGFDIGDEPISVPTLFIAGAADGCLLAHLSDGQETLFTGGYRRVVMPYVGHYPHLERPDETLREVSDWLARTNRSRLRVE